MEIFPLDEVGPHLVGWRANVQSRLIWAPFPFQPDEPEWELVKEAAADALTFSEDWGTAFFVGVVAFGSRPYFLFYEAPYQGLFSRPMPTPAEEAWGLVAKMHGAEF